MAPFQNTNRGYDVNAVAPSNGVGHNATLEWGNTSMKLFVQEFSADFAISGSTSQSASTRSFYPRNIRQPSFVISCQTHNQNEYAKIVEFIRQAQKSIVSSFTINIIPRKTGVKGLGERFSAEGYIKSVARTHEQFVYAPEIIFEFIVEKQIAPTAWADDSPSQTPQKIQSWKDIITRRRIDFIDDPDRKTATKSDNSVVVGGDE